MEKFALSEALMYHQQRFFVTEDGTNPMNLVKEAWGFSLEGEKFEVFVNCQTVFIFT
jgi:hypothetical protein